MVKITYVDAGGAKRVVDARIGQSVMEAAVKNGVAGIVAECGGNCACGTCKVHIDEAWRSAVGEPSEMERDMLSFADVSDPHTRLSCQIKVIEELDGLTLCTPKSQYWKVQCPQTDRELGQ